MYCHVQEEEKRVCTKVYTHTCTKVCTKVYTHTIIIPIISRCASQR